MPCNTAHYFLHKLQAETKLPFLSMLEATAKACAKFYPGKTAAVLATKGTLATGLYEKALEKEGVSFVIPDDGEKDVLMHLIYDVVKASKPLAPEEETWRELLEGASQKGRGLLHPRLHGASDCGRQLTRRRALHRPNGGACQGGHPLLRV